MRPALLLIAAISLSLLAGCSTPSFEDTPASEFGDAELYPVSSTGFNEVYARRDANLSAYQRIRPEALNLDNVNFSGPMLSGTVASQWQITEQRSQTLSTQWRSAINLAFSDYEVVEEGGQGLRITAELLSVQRRHGTAAVTTTPPGVNPNRRDSVGVSAEFRLYDLGSGDLLAVIRDSRVLHTEEWTRSSGMLMQSQFTSWTTLLQARVSGR